MKFTMNTHSQMGDDGAANKCEYHKIIYTLVN